MTTQESLDQWLAEHLKSMVVSGEKLEGEKLLGYIKAMNSRDKASIIEDLAMLEMMRTKYETTDKPISA